MTRCWCAKIELLQHLDRVQIDLGVGLAFDHVAKFFVKADGCVAALKMGDEK